MISKYKALDIVAEQIDLMKTNFKDDFHLEQGELFNSIMLSLEIKIKDRIMKEEDAENEI